MAALQQNSMIRKSRLLWFGFLVLIAVTVLGVASRFEFGGAGGPDAADSKIWTCSMHPQIRMNHPGRCPICGMDLVPVASLSKKPAVATEHQADHLMLSEHARQMATVETAIVEPRKLVKEIRSVGKIEFDETSVAQIIARISGRVDEVFASFPGTIVKEGQHLVSIYSPDLLSTQNEFLTSLRYERQQRSQDATQGSNSLSASARRRLELWGITAQQIDELQRTGEPKTHLTIYAPRGGTVVQKNIRAGQYVNVGDQLFTIADLNHVWLLIDVYESDLTSVKFGQSAEVTLESTPAKSFSGAVGFVEPVLTEATRSVRVRVVLQNQSGELKPGMYAQAILRVPLMSDGSPAPTGVEGKYACPMHPYVMSDRPGTCSVCKMPLEQIPGGATSEHVGHEIRVLAVPASAVLTTGRRQLVYVEQQPGEYHLVEPKLGPRAGDHYPVLAGLAAGQRVVVRGNFLLDSQFQISGNPSLLYPDGIVGGGAAHAGHAPPTQSQPSSPAPPPAHRH